MTHSTYASLEQFLGCYFHQDFMDEFESADRAIAAFLQKETRERANLALKELNELLSANLSSRALADLLFEHGCMYDPSAEGRTEHEWLLHVRSKLQEALI